jgi:hypothetical protein
MACSCQSRTLSARSVFRQLGLRGRSRRTCHRIARSPLRSQPITGSWKNSDHLVLSCRAPTFDAQRSRSAVCSSASAETDCWACRTGRFVCHRSLFQAPGAWVIAMQPASTGTILAQPSVPDGNAELQHHAMVFRISPLRIVREIATGDSIELCPVWPCGSTKPMVVTVRGRAWHSKLQLPRLSEHRPDHGAPGHGGRVRLASSTGGILACNMVY